VKSLLLLLATFAVAGADAKLPGTLYFVQDGKLAKSAGGVITGFDDVGAPVFPSPFALPDGRLVGIASKGDGEPGSEQLVLIGPGTKVERIGPAITQVRNPAVDRAGKWIVVEAKLEPQSELYKIDIAGRSQKSTRLTTSKHGNFSPATIDAKSIAFASSRDGDSEIYKLDVVTKRAKRLTAFHKDDWSPRPSPDGKTIAFLSDREGKPQIFLVGPAGTNLRRLSTGDGEEDEPTWSPDGKSIAFLRAKQLVVRDATGTERTFGPGSEPAWSPDGKWIAVTRDNAVVAVPLAGGAAIVVAKHARLPRWR
jgi:TolB protein